MALTTVSTGNEVKQWLSKFFAERTREDWFRPYTGTNTNDIIQVKQDLTTKKGGSISIPIVTRLKGTGVRGNAVLEGNEEELGNYNHDVDVFTIRNGVVTTENEEQKTMIDVFNAARSQLKNWILNLDRDDTITALMSMGPGLAYLASQAVAESNYTAVASEAQKDAYLANNSDRFLFGAAKSNNAANDHSAALANIDATNDVMSAGIAGLVKRMAQQADPHIRPHMTRQGEEWYVAFMQSWAMRDLRADTTIAAANREAWARQERMGISGGTNPIFRGGDILYDGVVYREMPEIPVIPSVGAASIDVAPNFLCGAQALAKVWARRTNARTDSTDYQARNGVAIDEMRGISKVIYDHDADGRDDIQHGVVTFYTAGVADA